MSANTRSLIQPSEVCISISTWRDSVQAKTANASIRRPVVCLSKELVLWDRTVPKTAGLSSSQAPVVV